MPITMTSSKIKLQILYIKELIYMRKTRRIKNTTYFWRYLIAIILALTVSTIASFFYFKPKFAFKSSFIEEIESRRLKTKPQEEKKDSPGLYKSIKEKVPDFKSLRILINGKEAESFGGHIDISGPMGEAIEKLSGEKIEGTI